MKFCDKLNKSIQFNQSLLYLELAPDPKNWPQQFGSWESAHSHIWGLQEWLQFLIAETADLVCAYRLTLEFYRALGASGLGLLHQTLSAIPPNIPVILDTHHSDPNTSTIFAQMIFATWQVDAVTLNPYIGQDGVTPFLVYPDKGVFILCATANPSIVGLQKYPTTPSPFYLNLVEEAKTWGIPEQLGLEVGGTIDVFSRIRTIAPERLILADELPAELSDLEQFLQAGLTPNGDGLLMPTPDEISAQESPRESLRSLRDGINQIRSTIAQGNPTCSVWFPNVCLLHQHPHKDLILQLYDIGCIHFGEFVQASGATFPYYIDLRTIISHPQVFEQVLAAYANTLKGLHFDRIAGIPYGSLPTATGLGLRLNYPMIFPRKEVKAHGTCRLVEGQFCEGETIVVIDDILITGKSVIEGVKKLQSVGLVVKDVVVLIDHEEGVQEKLERQGYHSHAVLKISEIAQTLYEAGRLEHEQLQLLLKL
ncbi:bifunctional orotidine 5'-phosphate decarboxylase/orotate phosphoribosyltransferase [Neosynechococcus sphagnicola sy1]|uniref:Orotate phosphoribosyltransferase n=1 Tax=Neosynechococcus sphagnicola sy1 TaxID=1497020 RepID=A0A098TN71_9CYAN|nr:bifunctional orotidine-5'-phosphate decarboxylase/orotate phosphoribosyltransferase [Neosynechococcus sphagnicola]KGF73744.1 bifunctional orotidine 5'-phosphate decarboxylase/orotate phosphoribosyltransferase [Neosynechococcus sphagnicola sy1]